MRRWWRISDPRWALDKTGQGAALYGGRWNPIGVAAVYAAESVALAALEKWVNLAGVPPARTFVLVAVDVPDEPGAIVDLVEDPMPAGWNELPASRKSEQLGASWLRPDEQGQVPALGFIVPSVIVPEGRNLVLNPAHPAMAEVVMSVERDFAFDARMLKSDATKPRGG